MAGTGTRLNVAVAGSLVPYRLAGLVRTAIDRKNCRLNDEGVALTYVDSPDRMRVALSPVRRELLMRLRTPSSASQLAAELGLPRQRLNYHLKELEKAGLVELVEERPRRGCVERILRTRPGALVVDPIVVAGEFTRIHDQYAAEHLVGVAAMTVRDVARMQDGAARAGKRLLTFALETEVRFARPSDVDAFTEELSAAVGRVVERYDSAGGRPYRMVALGHPAPTPTQGGSSG
jgi:DNA-binding transcriptional ArsR family regulator